MTKHRAILNALRKEYLALDAAVTETDYVKARERYRALRQRRDEVNESIRELREHGLELFNLC